MKTLPYKILQQHSDTCYAIKNHSNGTWSTPWSYLDGTKVEYRDSIGRLQKNMSGRRWWRVRCNCTHCPAEVTVREDYLLGVLPPGSAQRRRVEQ